MAWIFLAALFLAAILPSEPHAAFTEKLTIQAFDQKLRPVEGVEIYLDYRLNSVTTNARTKSKFTNQSGMADMSFTNYESVENDSSFAYSLYMKYGNQLYTYHLISRQDNKTRIVGEADIKSYYLWAGVRDQNKRVLKAKMTINNITKTVDDSGYATFQLPPGKYTLKAEIADAVKNKDVDVDQDRAVEIDIPLYSLDVYIKDDSGRLLSGKVLVEGREATTTDGHVRFENLSESSVQVLAQNNDSTRKAEVDLTSQRSVDMVFDRVVPEIKELHATPLKTGAATIGLYIEDPGMSASGIESVTVTYTVNGIENQVPAYSIGFNTYEAKIPVQPPKTPVKYVVKVSDKEGNSVFATGDYMIEPEKTVQQTAPVEPVVSGGMQIGLFGWGPESVAVVVVVACIVLAGVFYYLKFGRKQSGGFVPPPSSPPPEPP